MGCSVSSDVDPFKDCNDPDLVRSGGGCDDDDDCPRPRTTLPPEVAVDGPEEEVFEELCLTEAQLDNIRSSWLRLQPNLTAVGKQVFLRIFEFRPSVKRMFPFRDAWGDRLIRHPQFVEQARRFMHVIACVVDGLEGLEAVPAAAAEGTPRSSGGGGGAARNLVRLGRKHVTIEGFLPDYFDVFTRAIIGVWKQELKDAYTEETAEAWTAVFAFIIDNLKIGYEAEFKLKYMNAN